MQTYLMSISVYVCMCICAYKVMCITWLHTHNGVRKILEATSKVNSLYCQTMVELLNSRQAEHTPDEITQQEISTNISG